MSANDYFSDPGQKYQTYNESRTQQPSNTPNFYSQPSVAPSVAPSYHSNDPLSNPYASKYGQQPSHSDPSYTSYPEAAPPKPDGISTQDTGYSYPNTTIPPSPESQQANPDLYAQGKNKSRLSKWIDRKKVPYFVYTMTLIQLTVFIVEIIKNSTITGSPIMIKPQFNPMIGPSTYVLINMGARFVPCMRTTYNRDTDVPLPESPWPCPRTTTLDASSPDNQCTLGELCGLGSFDYSHPNQWYRFITPIFLHAGIIHIGFNMLLQMTMGRDMEKAIGTIRFAIVYFSSGIFGFVMGGNFAATGIASTGASGCLFGILALVLLDLLYTWKERASPFKELLWIMFDIVISFVLGLLPGLDNFSHIGGFLMGLALGICLLHSPNLLRERIGHSPHNSTYRHISDDQGIPLASGAVKSPATTTDTAVPSRPKPLRTTTEATTANLSNFTRQPVGFFKDRKPTWWAWWLLRAGALLGVLIGFVVLLTNFYKYRDQCDWCKYLSCLDITVNGQNWCDMGYITFSNTSTSSNKRGLGAELFSIDQALKGML